MFLKLYGKFLCIFVMFDSIYALYLSLGNPYGNAVLENIKDFFVGIGLFSAVYLVIGGIYFSLRYLKSNAV